MFYLLDNQKQQSSLNLLIGYIRLFGKYELLSVLHSTASKLIESLLYICELDQTNIQLLEEWTLQGFKSLILKKFFDNRQFYLQILIKILIYEHRGRGSSILQATIRYQNYPNYANY